MERTKVQSIPCPCNVGLTITATLRRFRLTPPESIQQDQSAPGFHYLRLTGPYDQAYYFQSSDFYFEISLII